MEPISVKQRGAQRAPAQAAGEPEAEDTIERRPKSWFKGKPEIASKDSWSELVRDQRTPIIDKDEKQLYLDMA